MPKTYSELYIGTRKKLRDAGIDAHSLEARLLVAYASGRDPAKLLQDLNLYTSSEVENRVEALTARRLNGEPVAYITGSWEFYGLPMEITPDVLIPRPDTEVLVDTAIRLIQERKSDARILDLCTGSGCVGCAMAHEMPMSRTVLLDNSRKALEVARRNIRLNGLSARCVCIEADVMSPPPVSIGSFDIIVSNPPYIASAEIAELDSSVKDYEPVCALDGGSDGLDFYRAILENWKMLLRTSGSIVFELGENQAGEVMKLMRLSGCRGVGSVKDTLGIDRVVFGRA